MVFCPVYGCWHTLHGCTLNDLLHHLHDHNGNGTLDAGALDAALDYLHTGVQP